MRFNSKIINVDSAWAHDVEKDGWEIPLWNRLSARERPQVYPRPDIAFVSTAEGDSEKPVVAQECLDPDYLFFFADFNKTTTADTDTWVSRLGLDYADMPIAKAIADIADSKSSNHRTDGDARYEQRRPSVGRILPGLRRFTWRLAPAAQKAALNAGRADAPVYVGLDSVSFMRATHATAGLAELDKNPKLAKALELSSALVSKPTDGVKINYWHGDGSGGSKISKEYSEQLNKLTKAIKTAKKDKNFKPVTDALGDLKTKWQGFPGALTTELDGEVKQAKDFLKGAVFDADLPEGGKPCDKLKNDAVAVIKRKEMLIRAAVRDWTADIERALPDLTLIKTKKALVDEITKHGIDYLRPLFDDASQDVAKVDEGVEKARAIVLELDVQLDAVFARARQRIDQFNAGYDRAKPWSDERLKAFHAGLRACASNIASDVFGLVDEARSRFASELNDASQAIGGFSAKALREIARAQGGLLSDIGALHGMITPYLGNATNALTALTPTLDKAVEQIDKADAAIDKAGSGVPDDLKAKAKNVLAKVKTLAGSIKTLAAETSQKVKEADGFADEQLNKVSSVVIDIVGNLGAIVRDIEANAHELKGLIGDFADDTLAAIRQQLEAIWPEVETQLKTIDAVIKDKLEDKFVATGKVLDFLVATTKERLDSALAKIREKVHTVDAGVQGVIGDIHDALGAVRQALAPASLLETVVKDKVLRPAVEAVLKPLRDEDLADADTALKLIRQYLQALNDAVEEPIRTLDAGALAAVGEISAACAAVFDTVDDTKKYLQALAGDTETYLNEKAKALNTAFGGVAGRIEEAIKNAEAFEKEADALIGSLKAFDHSVRGIQNDLARSAESARMYADRVFDSVGRIGSGGAMAAPSNILKLYSAVTTAPEIAALQADIDRIRSGFDELNDVIQTTKANALFNRLGDELKALGLSLPFDKIGDRLMPADLSDFDIGKVFRNFGGAKLDNLLSGYKIPAEVSEAVRVTHDFDKKQARAWVQVDIDAPMRGRRSLFSVGVFKADFVDMRLTGQVRLEASKDQDKVSETGFGRIDTTIDMVVGGQSMVKFEKFALDFTKEAGLKVEFDPKNIRLNPSFQYIQDFLSTIFPDKVGGLKIIKKDGMPIGVQHDFAMPPLALNFATSGVSNISIGNHFKLLAFPDFMLANQFNLSTIERPFIFSIFIIGGTGYIQIEAEYRPFDKELTVIVEAGAGGSASLAFAFGPFTGQVFITLSGVLTYRKVIGKPGGGLSISAVLVIAGHVDVAGIVTIGIVLMLRMSYRDNGQIDAEGSLTVEIRISRFFKITARANAKYKMRGGKSEVSTSADVKGEITDPALKKKYEKLQDAADKLKKART
ncbi:MAG: hypothetical protein KDJ16_17575 [Hyphomicrobiales bacterium]|nr:hypothetical protein [Hyphomicrobiales bacterium]